MKTRILGAIIVVGVFIPFLIIGELPFAIFMAALALASLYEMLKVRETKKKFPILLKIFAYILVVAFSLYNIKQYLLYF